MSDFKLVKLFFSYSHKDENFRDEHENHLSTLKRQGFIESWHDRRIGAGDEFDKEIDENLNSSQIILLLVSPYFLNSDYCYEKEMHRAMERHEIGEACVIPVIIHPCDWHPTPFGKLNAVPKDGRPISKFPNHHDAYLEIVKGIRKATERFSDNEQRFQSPASENISLPPVTSKLPRSSNLGIKKEFTGRQKDDFMDESFEYLANYFEGSLAELQKRNAEISTKFKRIDANHFIAIIYKNGNSESECKISLGGSFGGISYTYSTQSGDNSCNESLSCESDGHSLFLKPMGFLMSALGRNDIKLTNGELLSQEGAAEYFWQMLIRPLQE